MLIVCHPKQNFFNAFHLGLFEVRKPSFQDPPFVQAFLYKLDQGALGMSDPCGPLHLALKPYLVSMINLPLYELLLLCLSICCPLSSGRPTGSQGVKG